MGDGSSWAPLSPDHLLLTASPFVLDTSIASTFGDTPPTLPAAVHHLAASFSLDEQFSDPPGPQERHTPASPTVFAEEWTAIITVPGLHG